MSSKQKEKKKKKHQLFSNCNNTESCIETTEVSDNIPNQLMTLMNNEAPINAHLKVAFFIVCCFIMLAITGMLIRAMYIMLTYHLPNDSTQFAIELISVIGAFIAAFMKVIQTIAENLFTQKIPDSLVDIVTKKQEDSKD